MSAGISFIQWIMMFSFLITLRLWSVTGEAGEICAQQPVSGTLRLWSVTDEAGEVCAQQSVSRDLVNELHAELFNNEVAQSCSLSK